MAPPKNGGHVKSAQMTCLNCLRYISQRHPWAISSIIECFHGQRDHYFCWRASLKYQTVKSLNRGNCLTFDFLLSHLNHCNSFSCYWARLADVKERKKDKHKSLSTELTTYDLSTGTTLQWFSSTPMSILSAIRHFVRIKIIHSMYAPGRKLMCLVTVKDEDGNSQGIT